MLAYSHMKNTIRQIYFYAATLIFLIMSVVALISLLNLGLKTYLFTKADMANGMTCDGNGNYGYNAPVPMAVPTKEGDTTTTPQLTDVQKAANKASCEKQQADQLDSQRQNTLVQYLSMLVVAAPLFFLHFKWVQKDRETEVALAKEEKKA
jgi:hypothetical protein